MANFPKSPPAVGRSTGLLGLTGATGAAGNGAVFQSVDALSGTPRSVTDWGPILNSAISGGVKHFVFGPFTYPFSTQIALNASIAVVFQGTSGLVWPALAGDVPASQLVWQSGAGSGVAVNLMAADSFQAYDLAFCYKHGSGYNGDLVSHLRSSNPPSAFCKMERCYFGPDDPGVSNTKTANSLVNLTASVDPKLIHCSIQGAQTPIRGAELTTDFSNDVQIDGCLFSNWVKAAICNPTINWRLTNCTFEYGDTASISALDSDTGTSGTPLASTVTLQDCYFWDGAGTGQMVVNQRVGQNLILDVRNGYYGLSATTVPAYQLNGPGSFTMFGGNWPGGTKPYVDLGSYTTAFKNQVLIDYPGWFGNGAKVVNIDGHSMVNIRGYSFPANSTASQQMITESGAVRVGYSSPAPTLALHGTPAGVSSVGLSGTDRAGTILVFFNGSVTAGELIADFTFGSSLAPGNWPNILGGFAHRLPTVCLTPIVISGNSGGANTNGVAPPAFATVVDHSNLALTPANQTGWTFGVVNAGALTGQTLAWSYLVTEI